MELDAKLSFFAGWLFTTASTITVMGFFQAAFLGLVGGFFGLLGKEVYYYTRQEVKDKIPSVKSWYKSKIDWIKSKLNERKEEV